jgi:hypothetical protein
VTENRVGTVLDHVGAVVVSTPIQVRPPNPSGRWSQWCAHRRTVAPAGVGWGDPRLVVDLTGPVATVGLRRATSDADLADRTAVPARLVTTAAVAIVVLNVLDIITTRLALLDGATEGNPLAALFVHHLPIFVAIKVLLPGLVGLRMWTVRDRTPPMLLAAMWWVVGVYSMVITINALHLL